MVGDGRRDIKKWEVKGSDTEMSENVRSSEDDKEKANKRWWKQTNKPKGNMGSLA